MGMGFGMIGALAGAGKGLSDQSAYLAKMEDEDRAEARTIRGEERGDTRQRSYQQWLMEQREQFDVRSEGRADTRDEAKKDRSFEREKTEAPTRRSMKAEDITSEHGAKSAAAAGTADADAVVKKKMANAGVSDADEEVKAATADSLTANAEYTRGARTGLAEAGAEAKARAAGGGSKIESDDIKAARADAKSLQDKIDAAKLAGTFDPANPEHAKLERRARGLADRVQTMSEGRGTQRIDPQGLRNKANGQAPAPAGKFSSTDAEKDRSAILEQEMRKAQGQLAAAGTDEERQRAMDDIASLTREMGGRRPAQPGMTGGGPPPAPPRPAAPPPVVATPLPPSLTMGGPPGTAPRRLADMKGARDDPWTLSKYADDIRALRAKAGITEDPGE